MKALKVDNWPAFLLQRLHVMYQAGYKCDTILRFATEPQSVSIKVHSMVLNASTKFFELLPKQRVGPYTVMTLPFGIAYKELSAVINFLYTGQLDFKEGDPLQIYQLSQRLQVDILVKLLSVRFKGTHKIDPDDLLLRSDKIEFKQAPKVRGSSNIVLESGEIPGRVPEEEEEDVEDEEDIDEDAEQPGSREKDRDDPINLPESGADPVKLKVDPDDIDLEMKTRTRPTRKRVRYSEGTVIRLDDTETAGSDLARVSPRRQGAAEKEAERSVVDQIADDWNDEDDEGDESGEDSRDASEARLEGPDAKRQRGNENLQGERFQALKKSGADVDDEMVSQVLQRIPKVRDATTAGRNVRIVRKTVGTEELLRLQKRKSDGKRLACVVLKTVDPEKASVPSSTPTSAVPPALATAAPQSTRTPTAARYSDWQCNLCREIDRPHAFQSLQQLRSHYAGIHDMSVSVLCRVCGQDAPKYLASVLAAFVTYSSVVPNPETHLRCVSCRYVVIMAARRKAARSRGDRTGSPEPCEEERATRTLLVRKPDKFKPLQCKECGLTFRTAYNLSMHQKARHPRAVFRGDNTRVISVDAEGGIPLDQIAIKAVDGTLIELATSLDGQHVIVPEADLKPDVLGHYMYLPEGVEVSKNGTEQFVYVPVDENGTLGLFAEDGSALQCYTVGEDGAMVPTLAESPIVAQPVSVTELPASDPDAVLTKLSAPGEHHEHETDDIEEPFEQFEEEEEEDVKPETEGEVGSTGTVC